MNKHTKGPWNIHECETLEIHPFNDTMGTKIICEIPKDAKGNKKANAHLIASAPELLEALKQEHDFACQEHFISQGVEHDENSCGVCQLIKKAEGK